MSSEMSESEADDLQQYLSSQLEGKLHSEGIFTLDLQNQARRLQEGLLASPTLAFLKLIQAIIGCGTTRLELEILDHRLALLAHQAIWGNLPEQPAFSEAFALPDSPARDLIIGLASLLRDSSPKPTLTKCSLGHWQAGREIEVRCWFGPELSTPEPQSQEFKDGLALHLEWTPAGQAPIDLSLLRSRLFFSPIFVSINGKEAVSWKNFPVTAKGGFGSPWQQFLEYYEYRPPAPVALGARCSHQARYDHNPEIGWKPWDRGIRALSRCRIFNCTQLPPQQLRPPKPATWKNLWQSDCPPLRATCAVFVKELPKKTGLLKKEWSRGRTHLIVVKRGVCLDCITWPNLGGEATVVFPADEAQVDLSQFRLLERDQEALQDLMLENLENGLTYLWSLTQEPAQGPGQVSAVGGIGTVLAFLLGSAVGTPALGALLGGAVYRSSKSSGNLLRPHELEALHYWLGQLRSRREGYNGTSPRFI